MQGAPHEWPQRSPFLAYSLAPSPSPALAPTPTSLPTAAPAPHQLSGQAHQSYEGTLWVEDPAPIAQRCPAPSTSHSYPPHPIEYARLQQHGVQAYAEQHSHQQEYVDPSHAAPQLPPDYPPYDPALKRRRLSYTPYPLPPAFSAQPSPKAYSYPWQGSYGPPAQPEGEGAMLPPPSGTALRRASEAHLHVRRASAGVPSPAPSTSLLSSATAGGPNNRPSSAGPPAPASPAPPFLAVPSPSLAPLPAPASREVPSIPLVSSFPATPQDAAPIKERVRTPRSAESQIGLADKSCKHCRDKDLDCHYGNLVPIDLVKTMQPESRVAELEARIKTLELELASSSTPPLSASPRPPGSIASPFAPSFPSSHLPSPSELPHQIFHALLSALGDTLTPARLEAHTAAILASVHERAAALSAAAPLPPKLAAALSSSSPTCALLASHARADALLAQAELAPLSPAERVQHPSWPRLVAWALLDACWATCASNIPTFLPFHDAERKARLYVHVEALSPSERCAVLAMCALGVRSTADVALLGMAGLEAEAEALQVEGEDVELANGEEEQRRAPRRSVAVQRELIARSMRTLMMELYDRLEIAHGEGSEDALAATLLCGAVMMWNELFPRRSRSLVRVALGHYRDLFDAASRLSPPSAVASTREHLLLTYALPLLHQDGTTAAYLRAAPLVSDADLREYFAAFALPTLARATARTGDEWSLREEMRPWFDLDALGGANHEQLLMGSMVIYKWLAACLPRALSAPLSPQSLATLFSLLSEIHEAIQTLQHYLVNTPAPVHPTCVGADGDTCEHVHLRWVTRLDRETDDCTWLAFATVGERMVREEREALAAAEGENEIGADGKRLDVGWLRMCEGKVRQGLKRAAFYFNFFTISPDPHQTHHLAWSLELIPSWTFLAAQRYTSPSSAPPGGPQKKADELSETELDWIERGLEEARRYHPVAERRLVELRAHREAEQRRVERLVESGAARAEKGERAPLDFQAAMREALAMTVPSWG
ncbi:hypothetical protein JCM10449v2_002175 [Rhodotorula kratochvilovae]